MAPNFSEASETSVSSGKLSRIGVHNAQAVDHYWTLSPSEPGHRNGGEACTHHHVESSPKWSYVRRCIKYRKDWGILKELWYTIITNSTILNKRYLINFRIYMEN
uniref:Uncharacterized protein n=1 Tax=Micrurus surinamensis TaxID=129470 RepID=A0A2D4PBJ2_MICSU